MLNNCLFPNKNIFLLYRQSVWPRGNQKSWSCLTQQFSPSPRPGSSWLFVGHFLEFEANYVETCVPQLMAEEQASLPADLWSKHILPSATNWHGQGDDLQSTNWHIIDDPLSRNHLCLLHTFASNPHVQPNLYWLKTSINEQILLSYAQGQQPLGKLDPPQEPAPEV